MSEEIEQAIKDKGLTAPRVTPEDVMREIVNEQYVIPPGTYLTICVLTLRNGYTVTGESACADPKNFDAEIGQQVARKRAVEQIWPLLGFRLRDQLTVMADAGYNPEEVSADLVEMIARVTHEANRAWCAANGDMSQPSWDDAPDWQKDSAISGVWFHVDNPFADDSASHDAWLAEKDADGWVYGDVKDPEKKTHPCMVPFEDLPKVQQLKDALFRGIVHALVH